MDSFEVDTIDKLLFFLHNESVEDQPIVNNQIQQPPVNPVTPKSNHWLIAIIILVLILVFGSIYALSLSSRKPISPPPKPPASPPPISPTPTPIVIPTTDPLITANWKTYRNEEFGLLFSYPENRFPYFSEEVEPHEQLYLQISPVIKLESLRLTDAWMSVQVLLYSPDFTLDEYLNLHGDPEYYKDAKREPIEINGEQGYKITKHPRIAHEEAFSYVAQVKRGKYVYKLDLQTFLKEILLANEALFDQILSTFKFTNPENQVVCTQDAKLCPDGSYVSRQPPNCEFAKCP